MFTGAGYFSSAQRRRRIARIEASALFSPHSAGAGYMEALKRLLKGGVHLVRLNHRARNFDSNIVQNDLRGGNYFGWIVPPQLFTWAGIKWVDGKSLAYTILSGQSFPTIQITGLPPNSLVAVPGEFVKLRGGADEAETRMVIAPARSNNQGVARIRLDEWPSFAGMASLGEEETGVFEVDEMPRSIEPSGKDWSYSWSFTEVFEDERGPFVELNPWN